jgi:energy-converting hydrogenase Eha subunit A
MNTMLLRPFLYLRVDHGSRALPWMNWGLPAVVTAGVVLAGSLGAPNVNAFHPDGVFDRLLGFVQSLPGFYLAALAAVATFNRPNLDQLMPGTPPKVAILYHGKPLVIELTRRRFLCMLFAYLTALSFALTLSLVMGLPLVDHVREALHSEIVGIARFAVASCLIFIATQLVVITLWGLYYLGERMHTPD